MKIGKTKTHHKLYVTERELKVLCVLFGEGNEGLMTDEGSISDFGIDTAAVDRVIEGLRRAQAQSLGGEG
jgi:hypothetical protein